MRQGLELIIITEETHTDWTNKVVSLFVPRPTNEILTLVRLNVHERLILRGFYALAHSDLVKFLNDNNLETLLK